MRAASVDANQKVIVAALRDVGASVQHIHGVGGGCPDIIVGFRGVNYLIEIKDGDKPPSARKLTDAENEWHLFWHGSVHVANDIDEALEVIGAL